MRKRRKMNHLKAIRSGQAHTQTLSGKTEQPSWRKMNFHDHSMRWSPFAFHLDCVNSWHSSRVLHNLNSLWSTQLCAKSERGTRTNRIRWQNREIITGIRIRLQASDTSISIDGRIILTADQVLFTYLNIILGKKVTIGQKPPQRAGEERLGSGLKNDEGKEMILYKMRNCIMY